MSVTSYMRQLLAQSRQNLATALSFQIDPSITLLHSSQMDAAGYDIDFNRLLRN